MAVSWRRIAVPAAALGVLVPAALGTHALLSDSGDAGPSTAGARPSGSAGPEAVPDDAAAPGSEGAAVVAKPSNAPAGAGRSTAVRLSSYDARGRRAVLEPAAGRTVRTGDVIAAAPNRHAPSGALFKVDKATGSHGREVRVTTVPATLPEVLGDRKVDRRAVLRDGELSVRPLSAGVTVRTRPPLPAGTARHRPRRPTARAGRPTGRLLRPGPMTRRARARRARRPPRPVRPAPGSA
ncbi:hypothetical protein PQR15_31195 [Streptomyces lydicus]|nr:hypothetical protein [Streptomyces lydicus]